MPLVSIILPTRNRPALLSRAVASVLAQTEPNIELIVIDNSPARVPLPVRDARIHIVHAPTAPNAGAVRNVGLANARGEWIAFLDDDDAYRPAKLAAQLALAQKSGAPLVLCGAMVHLRGRARSQLTEVSQLMGDELLNYASVVTPVILHRRLPRVRFDEVLFAGEDMHYLQQLFAAFAMRAVDIVPQPLVDVYQNQPALHRTNLRAHAGWQAARRVWWQFGARYSPKARRLFVIRALMARAKLQGETRRVIALMPALLRAGGTKQMRYALNAVFVATGWMRGRWVT